MTHGNPSISFIRPAIGKAGYLLVLLFALTASVPAFAANYGSVCQDCDSGERQLCALETAMQMKLSHGNEVWVFDLAGLEAERYRVHAQGDGQIPRSAGAVGEPSMARVGQVVPIAWTPGQWDYVSGGMQFVRDLVLPNGGQILQECQQSSRGMIVVRSAPKIRGGTAAPVIQPVDLPASMYESAYDMVGNQSAGVAIGQWWAQQEPATSFLGKALVLANNLLNTPFNTEVVLVVEFSDGSRGVWVVNAAYDRWEADFDTFEDSDANPIPVTADDLVPGLGYHFSGNSPGENNLRAFLDRARSLGIPVTGPGGGGIPVDCRMTSEGNMKCWPATAPW